MTHRYFAGTEGILILTLSFSMFFKRKTKDIKSSIIAIALVGLLCVQVMLGMLTVTEKLKPVIVLSHLLTGFSILSVLWWAILDLYFRGDDSLLLEIHSRALLLGYGWPLLLSPFKLL